VITYHLSLIIHYFFLSPCLRNLFFLFLFPRTHLLHISSSSPPSFFLLGEMFSFPLDGRGLFFVAVGCTVRLFSALFAPVPDCDEIFNFWEPMHFIMHGKGMQTWEYSPTFGLRPYLYVLFHTGVAWALTLGGLITFKPFVFYSLRFFLGLLSLSAETLLSQQRMNDHATHRDTQRDTHRGTIHGNER
jgi:hypothetical protein